KQSDARDRSARVWLDRHRLRTAIGILDQRSNDVRRRRFEPPAENQMKPRTRSPRPAPDRIRFYFLLDELFLRGTFAPSRRASESPIAIACFRLVTFLPERPLFNFPCLRSRI